MLFPHVINLWLLYVFVIFLTISVVMCSIFQGGFWSNHPRWGEGPNLQGVHPLAGQGVMAPAAGDPGQRPIAGAPWLSSSPGCGDAPPGLYEVKDRN